MWQSLKTIYGRTNGDVKSAIQKFARRGMEKETAHTCLELFDGNNGKAVLNRLKIICVEDKFPQGSQYVHWFNENINKWKKMSSIQQRNVVYASAVTVAGLKSDRHVAYLCKVALNNAVDRKQELNEEEMLASSIEAKILKLKMNREYPTPKDITVNTAVRYLKKKLFNNEKITPLQESLWKTFLDEYFKDKKTTSRLYLYTLVALKFHEMDYIPLKYPKIASAPLNTLQIILPDYVFDKHTKKGKKMKRGLKHFLEVGAYIENPHESINSRIGTKRKAEEIYLQEEKTFGTKNANSSSHRKRIRINFCQMDVWNGEVVLNQHACKIPCGRKPGTWILETKKEKVFVKGPFQDKNTLDFQLDIDKKKSNFGIKPVGYEIKKSGSVYWLYAPVYEGKNMSPTKNYSDDQLMQLLSILIFRGFHGCSDSHLRNIMDLYDGNLLSVDEMTYKPRIAKEKNKIHFMDFLFSKKPQKKFVEKLTDFIQKNLPKVEEELCKYNLKWSIFNF